ncbi:MAG: oxidoreductase [Steroidobacteraceae bacterium]|jgi:NADPH2:quinone reductase|nr:oxidoreductase [Steroidobacteraceae bacterium]
MTFDIKSFRAFRIHRQDRQVSARFDDIALSDLTAGDVVVRVTYSDINYKDALAATGTAPILRKYPLAGGIDLAGDVVDSSDPRFTPGQRVLVTGCGLSETQDGGYAEYARVPGDWVIPVPPGMTDADAMKLGTAGFTAALAVHRMEQNGQQPVSGPVVVTGATGGVGSLAINMLAGRGYEVVAVSGKSEADAYLHEIGASQILRRQSLDLGSKPMEAALWAGAVDNVGGEVLTWLTRTMGYGGNIASVGLAASHELRTTVMPFILRGVNLLGINSVATPRELRLAVWHRLATDLRPAKLDRIAGGQVTFEELPAQFDDYIKGRVIGRTVVRIARNT